MDALSAADLRVHPLVVTAFAAAWADSFADDPKLRHEEGGWIYQHATSGEVVIRRTLPGLRNRILLSCPPPVADYFLVATYHTHPNPTAQGWLPDPSPDDYYNGDVTGVPWFIISDRGVTWTGPDRREGGLKGPACFPLIEDES